MIHMTYFEDFYATSAEFSHPTVTSSATLHPSVSLKVLNSPNAPASPPTYPPHFPSKKTTQKYLQIKTLTTGEKPTKQQAKFPPLPIDSHNVEIQKQLTHLVH